MARPVPDEVCVAKRDPHSLVGRNLGGRFRLDRLSAQHPHCVVYDAHDLGHDRPVAVRLLLGIQPPGPGFEQAARRLRTLHNRLLARLFASVRLADGVGGLITEPLLGETLAERLRRGVPTIDETVHILDELLNALTACHVAGIVHRDVQPENVRLASTPGNPHPQVILHGAGLAQLVEEHAGGSALSGAMYGHPLFTAPEQWVNRAVDARADVYAVGLIGYVLLQGTHFIRPGAALDVCRQHFKAGRPALHVTPRGEPIPDSLSKALQRAASPRPEDRFSTAEAMRATLVAVRAEVLSRPPLPRPPTGPLPALLDAPTQPLLIEVDDLNRITAELAAAFDSAFDDD